jgi:hypothetical protein
LRQAERTQQEFSMNHHRLVLSVVSMGSLILLGACGMAPMASTSTTLTARLSGAGEVPAVTTDAAGVLEANLAPGSNVLTWKLSYSGLSGPATGAHFHGPAMAGQNAAVAVPIGAPLGSPITGSATLTPGQVADLTAGKWYVNLHTAANPNGEARGQVTMRP